jgi:hypothetical protein
MSLRIRKNLLVFLSAFAVLPAAISQTQDPPQANADIDNRRGIMTRPNERTRILSSMRKYLIGLQAMSEALAREDMKTAAEAARSMGSINLYEVKLMFPNKAAIEFRELAFEVHRDFDVVARDTEEKKDPKLMLSQLATIMKKCAHCHDTYKLQDMAH